MLAAALLETPLPHSEQVVICHWSSSADEPDIAQAGLGYELNVQDAVGEAY